MALGWKRRRYFLNRDFETRYRGRPDDTHFDGDIALVEVAVDFTTLGITPIPVATNYIPARDCNNCPLDAGLQLYDGSDFFPFICVTRDCPYSLFESAKSSGVNPHTCLRQADAALARVPYPSPAVTRRKLTIRIAAVPRHYDVTMGLGEWIRSVYRCTASAQRRHS
jgi:hypothetical protein